MKLVVSFSLFSLIKQLQDEVAEHANTEESHRGDDLGEDAHPGSICGEGKYEAHRLPKYVVGEGGLLVVGEETSIEGLFWWRIPLNVDSTVQAESAVAL